MFSAVLQQSVLVTLLSLAVTVSGTSQGLSVTRGETAKIPCPFGEGIVRNISWYYTDASGSALQKILTVSHGVLSVEESYAHQAGLDQDNSSLILKKITVKDEGTYRCNVDREGQTSVSNISTKLNVYGKSNVALSEGRPAKILLAFCKTFIELNHSIRSATPFNS